MSKLTMWHNPRCSKSRQTLALLENKGLSPIIIKYLETPPSATQIKTVLKLLGTPAINLIRTNEKIFKELGLTKASDEDALITAMTNHPILIERPVVFHNGKAAIGRPPEAVLDII